jgi:hypothetical protein
MAEATRERRKRRKRRKIRIAWNTGDFSDGANRRKMAQIGGNERAW